MKTLCIVPCGKRKIWDKNPEAGPQKAKDVYIGPYAKKCIEYALAFYPECWCILSAKYGFLLPDDIIPGPYNVTFNKKSTSPVSFEELKRQVNEKNLKSDRIVSLGGKNYTSMVKLLFSGSNIIIPFEGKTLGASIRAIGDSIKNELNK